MKLMQTQTSTVPPPLRDRRDQAPLHKARFASLSQSAPRVIASIWGRIFIEREQFGAGRTMATAIE